MNWKRLEDPKPEEKRAIDREFRRKARFLVDETLGDTMVLALRELGWKAKGITEVGLSGRSDDDVLAYAWREAHHEETGYIQKTRW